MTFLLPVPSTATGWPAFLGAPVITQTSPGHVLTFFPSFPPAGVHTLAPVGASTKRSAWLICPSQDDDTETSAILDGFL